MHELTVDIETRSDRNIVKCGAYAYADTPYFDILLCSISIDGRPVKVYDLIGGDKLPDEILRAFVDENIIKRAFNVNFERVCMSKYLREHYSEIFHSYSISEDTVGDYLSPRGWRCTMIHSRYLGLPSSLADVGAVLRLQDQKMKEGKELIRYFCIPYDVVDGVPQYHTPEDSPEKWDLFKTYNKRDVEAEMEIDQKLSKQPVPDFLWEEFYLEQEINDRGIRINHRVMENAIKLDAQVKAELSEEMCMLTGVENPNSVYQLLKWLDKQGYNSSALGKKEVAELLKTADEPVRSVLKLRQQLAKSSVKKYQAMQVAACSDYRLRGMYQFYGANRTGRESSKICQLQNLPQNHMTDLAEARELLRCGDFETIELLYDNVPDVLSQLIRTTYEPRKGYKFVVCDYSAIEMRLSAWLAGEQWVIDTFASGGDIYCATASRMFGVPVEKNGVNGYLRQKGKQASLSCSYGGSKGALIAMGAIEAGMTEEELQPLVDAWREANPNIVRLWYDVDNAIKKCVRTKTPQETHGLRFIVESGFLFMQLPSGRKLAYVKPRLELNKFGKESVTYMGVGATKKWERLESFPGKWVENCIQGIARDILFNALRTLSHCFIVATVHDEIIIEADERMSVDAVCEQMCRVPEWAEGLLLRADGYECNFYEKR